MLLSEIVAGAQVKGLSLAGVVTVKSVSPSGNDALEVIYKDAEGRLGECLIDSAQARGLSPAGDGAAFTFDSPGPAFRLAVEALRIKWGYLFDPLMAVHTSTVEPLPHQISAVYESMLPRSPLRFALTDDPGAGKTIMAGLLIKELLLRADSQRVLIVVPGSLAVQWKEELEEKFGLVFKIFSRIEQDAAASGNFFAENDRVIARVDQLARNDEVRALLDAATWDLVVVDEAHKLSANINGRKIHKTERYKLGEQLGARTRHFLLMTATPHNGHEADFRLWLALLDPDRFAVSAAADVNKLPKLDLTDTMRRRVKEDMLTFDGCPLFPQRFAYTVNYTLSSAEQALYDAVTRYVRDEMNRADALQEEGRRTRVGFALTVLQRRLASSPAAIHSSLKRRRARLEERLETFNAAPPGTDVLADGAMPPFLEDDYDGDEPPDAETESDVDALVDQTTAARTRAELAAEIDALRGLEATARAVYDSGTDCKWASLSRTLQDTPEMRDAQGRPRKVIVFTEHKDTLDYLAGRITALLGSADAVRTISGATPRAARRVVQEEFRHRPDVLVLIATDAAGEGVNLQNTNLMVNYDLPWNPNRLEQRFGRIHRIGQTLPCHLWNLVAATTREGAVFQTLFDKLETERRALGGKVFDVLGQAFDREPLRELLIRAIRQDDSPDARNFLRRRVESAIDTERLREIMRRHALTEEAAAPETLHRVKAEMDRAEARKLQPYFVRAFVEEAFTSYGGELRARERGRWEIPYVPPCVRANSALRAPSPPVLPRYNRVAFEKAFVDSRAPGGMAAFLHPGHPFVAALTELVLHDHRHLLRPGAVMTDPSDPSGAVSVVVFVEHEIREADGRTASREILFMRLRADGPVVNAGAAPHLDLTDPTDAERAFARAALTQDWLAGPALERRALAYAAEHLAADHYARVADRRAAQAKRTLDAVESRLGGEILNASKRAAAVRQAVREGKQPAVQHENARRVVEELKQRRANRAAELEAWRHVVSLPPRILGAILTVPAGAGTPAGADPAPWGSDPAARRHIEQVAMAAVTAAERRQGRTVTDVSADNCGWDITSVPAAGGAARHIEVKGRAAGADCVTVSRNEILTALNQGDKYILAIVLVNPDDSLAACHLIPRPFRREPDPGALSVTFSISDLRRQGSTEQLTGDASFEYNNPEKSR